ncbi:MAG: lipopolysaccharide biosynthesis protein, partial [Oscillospiraceae bacterium]|nr:lipopolysaccharide biosynthesis protein [Oscillospiraceae bacterium]
MLNNIDEKELSNSQVNIVLKKEESNEESIVIPFREMLRGLKRFAVLWVAAAVLLALLVSTGIALFSHQLSSAPVALIGFDYDGIQWGKAPDGGDFDINSIKSPVVIEKALTSLGYSTNYVESVRKAISIDGIMPDEAIDKITVYRSAYEKTGNLQAADAMLGVDYNCTQYLVTFNFDKTPFGDDEAAQVINTVLDCYSDYFFETYSSNETIGNAGLAVDYTEYDYLISVDNYSDVLNTLRSTVDGLKYTDFRS